MEFEEEGVRGGEGREEGKGGVNAYSGVNDGTPGLAQGWHVAFVRVSLLLSLLLLLLCCCCCCCGMGGLWDLLLRL